MSYLIYVETIGTERYDWKETSLISYDFPWMDELRF